MKPQNTIKQIARSVAFAGLYIASFSAVLAIGIFALDGGEEAKFSIDTSSEESENRVVTHYDVEMDEANPHLWKEKTKI